MALLGILAVVFLGVALMVIVGEKHAKPLEPEQQNKLNKFAMYAVFALIITALIKALL